ncbi:MAG: deoxyribodipyrimidine photolyase [Armatimonadota bacterium]|nr:MAG: deoxyribodipyrimidine photolyase [Armatimonadota bacterium]
MANVPELRVERINSAPVRADGDFVLYWMIASRRTTCNFALQRAVEWAKELGKPLVVLEALRVGYRWASDRLHRFVLDGMSDNARRFENRSVLYHPYAEPEPDAGKGLLAALAGRACVVVTDDFPCFFLPRMVGTAAGRLLVRAEQVDSNGLLPLRAADRVFTTAYSFRRFLHKHIAPHLSAFPAADPLAGVKLPRLRALPGDITRRWPKASPQLLRGDATALAALPVDHAVGVTETRGGSAAAAITLKRFVRQRLPDYADARNEPEREVTSDLSPYLHFGHISAHEVFAAVTKCEGWSLDDVAPKATGSRSGWWGMSEPAEAFLDQLVTWRELGFNMCFMQNDYDRYESLPDWAKRTLAKHAGDARPYVYAQEQLETGRTHDPLWNAAQMQLVREGRLHNYLRMLWGKKILEWSPTPQDALRTMIELNNKYALDGRDPNSYSGILWCLGRYDRAWGPERPIFGTVRYMSSQNTARKVRVKEYIRKYVPGADS